MTSPASSAEAPDLGTPSRRGSASAPSAAAAAAPPSPTSAFHSRLLGSGLLRPGDSLVQTVRLESAHPGRQRYLCLVSSSSSPRSAAARDRGKRSTLSGAIAFGEGSEEVAMHGNGQEYLLLGVDRTPRGDREGGDAGRELETTLGLVTRVMWNVEVSLDGDGGFSLRQPGRHHLIFKPISVQALWTVIQALHMIISRLRPQPDQSSSSVASASATAADKRLSERTVELSAWELAYPVTSPQSCINEWHAMADLLVKRPPSPDRRSWGGEGENPEVNIKNRLRVIMRAADLDAITSKAIRTQLEADVGESLEQYKTFIDKEMLVILGQMDPASKITDYLYLGSEWNASNLEELQQNGISHILNVTREIDNFFPADFVYKNVREYDEEATELLKYLDRTYRFIRGAKESGGKVLVHCKMGISRSATVTIAFVMKEYLLSLEESLRMVRGRRGIVKPNKSFLKQLEVYEGILGAIRHRHTYLGLFRSKSESSLVPSPVDLSGAGDDLDDDLDIDDDEDDVGVSESGPKHGRSSPMQIRVDIKALTTLFSRPVSEPTVPSSFRPKSWSPNEQVSQLLFPQQRPEGFRKFSDLRVPFQDQDDCRCFGEMSLLSDDIKDESSPVGDDQEGAVVVEAKNPLMGMIQPVNSSLFDPDCACDMELELKVPEAPVDVAGGAGDDENGTDDIVRSISNVPLQVRTRLPEIIQKQVVSPDISLVEAVSPAAVEKSVTVPPPVPPPLPPAPPVPEVVQDELSVKHLASLFDYKIGSVPYRPCSAKLEDCRLFQRAKRLAGEVTGNEESNC